MVVSRMKKVLGCLVASLLFASTLTACSDAEVEELRNIEALNGESDLASVNMSVTDKEAAVYAQVSSRTLLDLNSLSEVSENDRQAVVAYMDSVDAQLCGSLDKTNGVIDECYTDYLLMEFQKTPYYWQRSQMQIMGMDETSRSVIVDVTYKTIDFQKDVQDDSNITMGEPNYNQLLKVRYDRWIDILGTKYSFGEEEYEAMFAEFERVYGDVDEIIESQRNETLTEYVYETGNQKTYTGLVNSDTEQIGATMRVRYVLVPQYTLGINQGFNCQHMYITDYRLNSDPTEGRTLYTEEDCATIASSVYNTLYRYYTCIDEDDYSGLYKLTSDFEGLDKAFSDLFETSYRKHDNFNLSIFSINGTKIECGVDMSSKIRAKGSNMTFPIYTDRYYYTIELVDGGLQVTNEVLLSRVLEGEPAVNTEEVSTTGFTSSISLTNEDKKEIENLIANLGAQQLLQDTVSDNFSDIIDMSISQSAYDDVKNSVMSLSGQKKAVWLVSYLQGQSNYASVKCRELYQQADNSITEAQITYDFIYKGGRWYVYDVTINMVVNLDSSELVTKTALCVCSAGNVDSLVSQAGDVEVTDDGTQVAVITTDYDEYTPTIKSKDQQTEGIVKITEGDITEEQIHKYITVRSVFNNYNEGNPDAQLDGAGMYQLILDTAMSVGISPESAEQTYITLTCNYENYIAGYISQDEYESTQATVEVAIKSIESELS